MSELPLYQATCKRQAQLRGGAEPLRSQDQYQPKQMLKSRFAVQMPYDFGVVHFWRDFPQISMIVRVVHLGRSLLLSSQIALRRIPTAGCGRTTCGKLRKLGYRGTSLIRNSPPP